MSHAGDVGVPTPGMNPDAAKIFYDEWSSDYTKSVSEWGYDMPDKIAATLAAHVNGGGSVEILDAGAGDGLCGVALRSAGFKTGKVHAIDLSPKLLQIASGRGVYDSVQEADLSAPLAFADDTFDALACVGVLTYLQPDSGVLGQFARVCKPGGVVAFNLRTDHICHWEAQLNAQHWSLVSRTEPLPYLPNNPEYGEKIKTVIFCYRVTANTAAVAAAAAHAEPAEVAAAQDRTPFWSFVALAAVGVLARVAARHAE
jgi:ubiquinone/menaquinone biosynthesis C-methylase UbiE